MLNKNLLLGIFVSIVFSQNIWSKVEFYFEVDLLLGLQNLIKKNYSYFKPSVDDVKLFHKRRIKNALK